MDIKDPRVHIQEKVHHSVIHTTLPLPDGNTAVPVVHQLFPVVDISSYTVIKATKVAPDIIFSTQCRLLSIPK